MVFVALVIALVSEGIAQEGNYSSASVERLNLKFRELYAAARTDRLKHVGPVIIARGDGLTLLQGDIRTQGQIVHSHYHDLKTISHVPLALFCIIGGHVDNPLDATKVQQLREFLSIMKEVSASLPEVFSDVRTRADQLEMLGRCRSFSESVLKTRQCSEAELDQLIDDIRPVMLRNIEQATRLRIDNYHSQMKLWRKKLSEKEWKHLHVVIPGAAMPRKNSAAVQNFSKLLRERGEGKRVIYAESQFDEAQDMNLLGTHVLDSQVGVAFFGDPWRMQRDLLGSAADSYLDSLDFDEIHDSK